MICHEEKKENFAGFRRNERWEKTEQIISIDADALCIPSMNRSREGAAGQGTALCGRRDADAAGTAPQSRRQNAAQLSKADGNAPLT